MYLSNGLRRRFLLLASALLSIGSIARGDAFLTGATVFSSDSTGPVVTPNVWNTLGGDKWYNIYFTSANTTIHSPFINSGNAAAASPSIDLTPGSYQFYLIADPGMASQYEAVNLFFSGNTGQPTLSAFAPLATTSTAPAFSVDASPSTLELNGNTKIAGAGTLSATIGDVVVNLTGYSWSQPSVYNLDRVSEFDSTADGLYDYVGSITLNVTPVPEPGAVGLLLAAPLLMRRATRCTSLCT
jgi:hypothetical protein